MDDDETVMSAYVFIETVASIVIQTAVRRFLASLYVESLIANSKSSQRNVSKEILNTSYESTNSAAYVLGLYKLAAVQIQAVFRGFWVRDCLDVDHYCSNVIQTCYRKHCYQQKYRRTLRWIIMVQSWWRRNIARDYAANILADVIIAQAVFRGYRVRRRFQNYRERKLRVMAVAAIIIQSKWRAFSGEMNYIRSLVDILIVQTVVRRWLAKREVSDLRSASVRSKIVKNMQSRRSIDESFPIKTLLVLPKLSPRFGFDEQVRQSPTDETDDIFHDLRKHMDPPGLLKPGIKKTDTPKMSPSSSKTLMKFPSMKNRSVGMDSSQKTMEKQKQANHMVGIESIQERSRNRSKRAVVAYPNWAKTSKGEEIAFTEAMESLDSLAASSALEVSLKELSEKHTTGFQNDLHVKSKEDDNDGISHSVLSVWKAREKKNTPSVPRPK